MQRKTHNIVSYTNYEAVVASISNPSIGEEATKTIAGGLGLKSRDIGRMLAKSSGQVREVVDEWCSYTSCVNSELQRNASKRQVFEICGALQLAGLGDHTRMQLQEGPEAAPTPEKAPKTPKADPSDAQRKLDALQDLFGGGAKAAEFSDEDKAKLTEEIRKEVREEVLKEFGPGGGKPTRIIVDRPGPDGERKEKESVEHSSYPLVECLMRAGVNIALVGPAGTGKTTLVERLAAAMEKPFFAISCSPTTLKGAVIGRIDPMSKEHFDGPMTTAMRVGGYCLLDEADKCNPQVLPMINAATANRWLMLENGDRVDAHEDTRFVLAMNTFGTGATDLYASARQDAATMDRFFLLHIDYDAGLEAAMTGCDVRVKSPDYSVDKGGKLESKEAWFHYVQAIRQAIVKHNIRTVVSPRATMMGIALAEQGVGVHWLQQGLIFKGLKQSQVDLLKEETKTCKLIA